MMRARFVIMIAIALLVGAPAMIIALEDGKKATDAPPLVQEMIVLDDVFRDILSAVMLGDGHSVSKYIQSLNMIKNPDEAERSLEGRRGISYAGKADYKKLHREFRADMTALMQFANENDGGAMLRLSKKIIDDCYYCHQAFRK